MKPITSRYRLFEHRRAIGFLPGSLSRVVAVLGVLALAGCPWDSSGPDPIPPRHYELTFVDNGSLPAQLFSVVGGSIDVVSATLTPNAVGRTIDQRLVNDRTGRGSTGGNSRDTTVARGEFMDVRVIEFRNAQGSTFTRDSSVVEVTVQGDMFIIKRPHPNPNFAYADTGYFIGNTLHLTATLDYRVRWGTPLRSVNFAYRIAQ